MAHLRHGVMKEIKPKALIATVATGPIIWLIGLSFFIARGFIKTGLGKRIAFYFLRMFSKSSLGICYGLGLADLLLAPAIPSNTARAGGIIFPIMKSIATHFDSLPEK